MDQLPDPQARPALCSLSATVLRGVGHGRKDRQRSLRDGCQRLWGRIAWAAATAQF